MTKTIVSLDKLVGILNKDGLNGFGDEGTISVNMESYPISDRKIHAANFENEMSKEGYDFIGRFTCSGKNYHVNYWRSKA